MWGVCGGGGGGDDHGLFPISCSLSSAHFWGILTWPALRAGSELFLGFLFLVTLAAVSEESATAPTVTRELEQSSFKTWNLSRADDCKVGVGGSQQLCGPTSLRAASALNQSDLHSLAMDVKFGSHKFARGSFLCPPFCVWFPELFHSLKCEGRRI